VGIAVVCLVPWFVLNIHNYGGVVPGARGTRLAEGLPTSLSPAFVAFDLAIFNLTYWSGEPVGTLPLAGPFAILGLLLGLMGLAGVIGILRLGSSTVPKAPFLVAVAAVAGLVGVTLLFPATAGFVFGGPGRYAYPALPAAAALSGLGISTVLSKSAVRRAVAGLYGVAAAGLVVSSALLPIDRAAGAGMPPAGARMLQPGVQGEMSGVTLQIDRIAMDDAARAIWVSLTATNSSSTEAEWTVGVIVSAGDSVAYGDYRRSTQLPGDLEPGQRVAGWLFVPLDPAHLHAGDSLRLRFPDVAVDSYRRFGDIDVVVRI
jgi:hypothetical protein